MPKCRAQSCGSLPAQYFKRRRGLANGFVFAGGGLGGFVLSITMDSLLNTFGIAWTFRILGFITLAATLPVCMLLKERTRRSAATVEWYENLIRLKCLLTESNIRK